MIDNPALRIAQMRRKRDGAEVFSFALSQYWLIDAPVITLHAMCVATKGNVSCVVTNDGEALHDAIESVGNIDAQTLDSVAAALNVAVIRLDEPMMLETIRIEKPWGAEIWYTGVEERGVCTVQGTPLPWIIALAGDVCLGAAAPELVLLKILDPLPDVVYGDLYFEMHEHKIEVYVVTHVDRNAWPDGTGGIRFGFDRSKLEQFQSVDAFRQAWLDSVDAYRDLRTHIDNALDQFREADGIGKNDVVAPAIVDEWKSRLDSSLNESERACREAMDEFYAMQPLEPGDVVRVPPFTPHSLQHGVRVVEFQTPHYERYILSFAQKVLTQDHWDTREAIDRIDWHAEFDATLDQLEAEDDHRVERVANFDAFEVRRIRLEAGAVWHMRLQTYAIAMAIEFPANVCGTLVEAEQACLIPACAGTVRLSPARDHHCVVLLAIPNAD